MCVKSRFDLLIRSVFVLSTNYVDNGYDERDPSDHPNGGRCILLYKFIGSILLQILSSVVQKESIEFLFISHPDEI